MKNFPSHLAGWRAHFRLGEIAGRSAKAELQTQARDHFLETINRYPTSPGADRARATSFAASSSSLDSTPVIAPRIRSRRTSARVSMPESPTTPARAR
ncbi:MAG: hypothetical protein EBX36_08130 [Planctomycetia bacterium]|nr:hypothetical protein [Planctomycetia bacterium]